LIYRVRKGQVSYGEAIGIILIENFAPFIPGDVANASTYSFPVRFQRIKGLTGKNLVWYKDTTMLNSVIEAGKELVKEGVRAVTGDCGYLALYQKEVANQLGVPVFLSSLLQVPFIFSMLSDGKKVGIICANSETLDASLLEKVGVDSSIPLYIKGMQNQENYLKAFLEEVGVLDSDKIEKEVVSLAEEMIQEEPKVGAILLESSVYPPYGAAVQEAVNLPVFDYVTMINYVYSSVVKKRFHGFM